MHALALISVLCVTLWCCYGSYVLKPVEIDFSKPFITFKESELVNFDGSDPEKPLYMSVKGTVFDVSQGARFYGKASPYNALVGRDASRAVAKMSLEPSDLTSNLDGLTDEQLKSLDDIYSGTYLPKYPVVGYLDRVVDQQRTDRSSDEL